MKIVNALVLFLLLSVSVLDLAAATEKDGVVLTVGDVDATVYELRREMQRILPMNTSFHRGVSKEKMALIREKALQSLIDQTYKVQYAIANKITVPKEDVESMLTDVRAQFNSAAELKKKLAGETLEELKASIYRLLIARKAEELVVESKAVATDEEVKNYYEEHKETFFRPKRYRASQIFVKVDPSLVKEEKAKLLEEAEQLAKRAQAGEDFYNLAYFNSDEDRKYVGGDMGYFHSGQLKKEFEDAIASLEPGEIVGPLQTLSGFHIIKLTEVEEPRQLTFDEVSVKIRKRIEDKRREQLHQEWIDSLKAQYQVETYLP